MTEVVANLAKLSMVDVIQARIVSEGWCKSPSRVVMFNSFDMTCSAIILMVFSGRERYPAVVAKLSRNLADLKREFDNLRTVQSRIAGFSPAPLFFEIINPFGVLGMRGLRGKRCGPTWDERIDRIPPVVERLICFHKDMQCERMDSEETIRAVREPFEVIRELGRDQTITDACKGLNDSLAMHGISLPRILQHGDFYFDNIMFEGEKITVLDWEDFGKVSIPGYDLFSLFSSFYLPWDAAHEERFFRDERLSSAIKLGIRRYFSAMDLPVVFAHWLFPLTFAQQFLTSHLLRRSSVEHAWMRLSSYFEHRERFSRFIDV